MSDKQILKLCFLQPYACCPLAYLPPFSQLPETWPLKLCVLDDTIDVLLFTKSVTSSYLCSAWAGYSVHIL